jgi:[3-methyl-2-oxobutanoate dehydrogenase (acetyl-transferring)] kinase
VCKQKYGIAPKIRIDGHIQASFVYMPLPVQYILPELLKNAFRATVENNLATANGQLPDVCVTISLNEKDCIIRIRDRGGGIPHAIVSNVFDYHFTTSAQRNSNHHSEDNFDAIKNVGLGLLCEQSQSQSVMYGYGFGLPTSKVYAEYLGGSLSFQSMQGIGSDFYLRLALLDSESSTVRI